MVIICVSKIEKGLFVASCTLRANTYYLKRDELHSRQRWIHSDSKRRDAKDTLKRERDERGKKCEQDY